MSAPSLFYPAGTLQPKDKWSAFYTFERAFDARICDQIIELGRRYPVETATVRAAGELSQHNPNALRDCRIRWIPCEAPTLELFRVISEMVTVANNEIWQSDISGFIEKLQFTEYDRAGSHYHWHVDTGGGVASLRKLSFTLQLTPSADYDGGDLEFTQPIDDKLKQSFRERGTAIIFPAYLTHRVTPVTRGQRISLVGWIAGPPYR